MSSPNLPSSNECIRVLHVDDDPDHLTISKRMIERINPQIQIESVKLIENAELPLESYDCILLDYKMPAITGIELAETIRDESDIPIILYTGQGSEEVAEEAFEVGIDDYIRKEFEVAHYQVLAKRIRMAVERYRAKVARTILEEQNAVTLEILQILNREEDTKQALLAVISKIKQYTGMEALAIRLHDVDDYPYYVWNGFPDYFVKMESSLCSRNHGGEPLRNEDGSPVLECMCGNVIRGRFDSSLPFFTEGGSFWSNCTSELLASTTEEERQARTRNKCNGEGYETVVLIPLRNKTETIGLLQLNDKRVNKVSHQMVRFLEGLAESVGVAMVRVIVPKDYLVDVMDLISEESPTSLSSKHTLQA